MYEALIDNDVIIAIARYDLMTEFDTITRGKCSRPHRCCPLARYSMRLGQSPLWHAFPTQGVHGRAKAFIDACRPLPNKPNDAALIARLLAIPGVDEGEAAMIDYAFANQDAIIITADQTCTFTIATDSALSAVAKELTKRVVHLECIFETMHNRFGIGKIRSKIFLDSAAHAGITSLLGDHHSEATARDGLALRIQTLEADLAGMLLTPF